MRSCACAFLCLLSLLHTPPPHTHTQPPTHAPFLPSPRSVQRAAAHGARRPRPLPCGWVHHLRRDPGPGEWVRRTVGRSVGRCVSSAWIWTKFHRRRHHVRVMHVARITHASHTHFARIAHARITYAAHTHRARIAHARIAPRVQGTPVVTLPSRMLTEPFTAGMYRSIGAKVSMNKHKVRCCSKALRNKAIRCI